MNPTPEMIAAAIAHAQLREERARQAQHLYPALWGHLRAEDAVEARKRERTVVRDPVALALAPIDGDAEAQQPRAPAPPASLWKRVWDYLRNAE